MRHSGPLACGLLSDHEYVETEFLPSLSVELTRGSAALQLIWTPRFADDDYTAGMVSLTFTSGG